MPAPWLILSAIQAAGAGVQYLGRKKRPRFGATAQGKFLQGIGREGRFSRTARRNILSGVAQEAGNIAANRRAATRGALISRGFEGSIAGIRALDQPGADLQRQLGRTRRNIQTENELSKVRAQEAFAMGETGYDEASRQERNQALQRLIGGLTGAAQTGFGGQSIPDGFRLPDNFGAMTQNQLYEFAINNKLNYEELEELWYMVRASSGGSRGLGGLIPQLPGLRR